MPLGCTYPIPFAPLPMRVFVTGGSGFVGQHVVSHLLSAGHKVTCLLRSTGTLPFESEVDICQGDILKPEGWSGSMSGHDAVIHLVGIIQEKQSRGITFDALHRQATVNVVDAAKKAGVSRFVQMSANGASEHGVSGYQTSKWHAEQAVKKAGFSHWTIFRPSLIFGQPGPGVPEFATQLVNDLIRPFPVWPVFGDGTYCMQPIQIENVAQAFVKALETDAANENTYCLAGPEPVAFNDLLGIMADGAGIRRKPLIHQPLFLMRPAVSLLGGIVLPITSDQLNMLVEGNTCDPSSAVKDLGLELIAFNASTLSYLAPSS